MKIKLYHVPTWTLCIEDALYQVFAWQIVGILTLETWRGPQSQDIPKIHRCIFGIPVIYGQYGDKTSPIFCHVKIRGTQKMQTKYNSKNLSGIVHQALGKSPKDILHFRGYRLLKENEAMLVPPLKWWIFLYQQYLFIFHLTSRCILSTSSPSLLIAWKIMIWTPNFTRNLTFLKQILNCLCFFCVGHDEGLTEFESFCMIFPPRPFTSSLALACLNSTWPT